ncbi:MAG: glycosyltransferase family 2 protein [Polyangiaceae bacterium]
MSVDAQIPARTPSAGPRPRVTIVCPVFNEEKAVPLFYERFQKAIAPVLDKVEIELLFVNNRSVDRTLDIIQEIESRDPNVKHITFSRNYGYQASITGGMRHATGDAVGNIDVDCEDPPEMIPRFIERWLAGVDVVYGLRDKREEFYLMHVGRKLFYRGTRRVADHEIILDMAEFFLVDKRVRDAALTTKSTFPFVRGQVGFVGFKREGIPYKRQKRIIGETHYNLLGAARFGVAGILSSSTLPLRILAYVGVLFFVVNLALAAALIALGPAVGIAHAATVLVAFVVFQLGWVLLAFGALGLYLARVYKDVVGLPLYVVDESLSSFRAGPLT